MNENAFASAISCCIFTQFFTVFTIFPKRLSSPLANVLQIAEHKFQYSIVSAGVLKGPQTGLTPVRQLTVCVWVYHALSPHRTAPAPSILAHGHLHGPRTSHSNAIYILQQSNLYYIEKSKGRLQLAAVRLQDTLHTVNSAFGTLISIICRTVFTILALAYAQTVYTLFVCSAGYANMCISTAITAMGAITNSIRFSTNFSHDNLSVSLI